MSIFVIINSSLLDGNLLSLSQALGKITPNGVYLEQLETEPWKYMPEITETDLHDDVVKV